MPINITIQIIYPTLWYGKYYAASTKVESMCTRNIKLYLWLKKSQYH